MRDKFNKIENNILIIHKKFVILKFYKKQILKIFDDSVAQMVEH